MISEFKSRQNLGAGAILFIFYSEAHYIALFAGVANGIDFQYTHTAGVQAQRTFAIGQPSRIVVTGRWDQIQWHQRDAERPLYALRLLWLCGWDRLKHSDGGVEIVIRP